MPGGKGPNNRPKRSILLAGQLLHSEGIEAMNAQLLLSSMGEEMRARLLASDHTFSCQQQRDYKGLLQLRQDAAEARCNAEQLAARPEPFSRPALCGAHS